MKRNVRMKIKIQRGNERNERVLEQNKGNENVGITKLLRFQVSHSIEIEPLNSQDNHTIAADE